jgi:hypothetical protein
VTRPSVTATTITESSGNARTVSAVPSALIVARFALRTSGASRPGATWMLAAPSTRMPRRSAPNSFGMNTRDSGANRTCDPSSSVTSPSCPARDSTVRAELDVTAASSLAPRLA